MNHQKDRLRRDLRNNPRIFESVEKSLKDGIVSCARISDRYNATYGKDDFNSGMLQAAMLDASVGGCGAARRKATDPSPFTSRYSRHSPSDEWFRNILSRTDEIKTIETFNLEVKGQLKSLHAAGRLPEVLDVAIDLHQISCHSKRMRPDLRGGKRKGGTNWFETYISAQCVNPGSRLVLAVQRLDRSSAVHESLREALETCRESASAVGSSLGLVLVDRGFFSVGSISEIESLGLDYVMPCTRTAKVKDALASFAAGTLGSVSKQEMKSSSKASIRYDMVIEPKKKRRNKESERPEDKYVAFATNTPWTDMEEYGRRWGIETGYRMVENARAKTSSVKKPARIFCFLYSLMLFNAWILANAALAAFLKLREDAIPISQLHARITILMAIFRNAIPPEPPPDPGVK